MIELFAYIANAILLVNLILYFKGFSLNGKAFNFFVLYLLIITIIQFLITVFQFFRINNLMFSHFYFIFQFIVLTFFYLSILIKEKQKKILKISSFFVVLSLLIQYFFTPSLFFKFNLFEVFITSFLLIIYSVFHLYNQLDEKKNYYYINLGILIYLFGSTVFFLAGNLIIKFNNEWGKIPWYLNAFMYIVYQLFILYEWKSNKSNFKTK